MSHFLKSIQPILNEIVSDLTEVTVGDLEKNQCFCWLIALLLAYREI